MSNAAAKAVNRLTPAALKAAGERLKSHCHSVEQALQDIAPEAIPAKKPTEPKPADPRRNDRSEIDPEFITTLCTRLKELQELLAADNFHEARRRVKQLYEYVGSRA
jgi:hypothetical protein